MSAASAALVAALCVQLTAERSAAAEPVLDGLILAGVDQDTSAIGRGFLGGMWTLGRFAPEAHIGFEGFLRLAGDKGVAARSFTLLDLGARYAFTDDHFVGPFATVGGSFGIFTGKPHDRRVADDPDTCATAAGDMRNCGFRIDKNATLRGGFGYGFASGPKTTVAVRLDVHYWMFSVNDFEDQPAGAPIPREIPRPQDSFSVLIGLEFMRWR